MQTQNPTRSSSTTLHSVRLQRNNFDLLRLLLATTVCLVHIGELSGDPRLHWITIALSSAVAVKAFFVVSGFLIFMSFDRSTSLRSFANKRLRRIYPAYGCVIVLCAFGLTLASTKGVSEYFSSAWVKYLIANASFLNFLQPDLPGVFEHNRLKAVNGALWTLKVEVLFYISVPVFALMLRQWPKALVMAMIYLGSVAYAAIMQAAAQRTGSGLYAELSRQLPGQLSYFISGAFFYYFMPLLERHTGALLGAAALILALNNVLPLGALEPFALATVVMFFALFIYLGNFGKYGDFSFGVYILHFPIIQLLLQSGTLRSSPWLLVGSVLTLTALAAIAMWHVVEKRFLMRGNHYVSGRSTAQGRPA